MLSTDKFPCKICCQQTSHPVKFALNRQVSPLNPLSTDRFSCKTCCQQTSFPVKYAVNRQVHHTPYKIHFWRFSAYHNKYVHAAVLSVTKLLLPVFYLILGWAHMMKYWRPNETFAYARWLWSFPSKYPLKWFKAIYTVLLMGWLYSRQWVTLGFNHILFPRTKRSLIFNLNLTWLTRSFKAFDQGKQSKLSMGKKKSTLRQWSL